MKSSSPKSERRETFTDEIHRLLRKYGWYYNAGFREKADPDRGIRASLSAGQVVDELMRRDIAIAAMVKEANESHR